MKRLLILIFLITCYSKTTFSQSSVSASTSKSKNISNQNSLEPPVNSDPGSVTHKNLLIFHDSTDQPVLILNTDTVGSLSIKKSLQYQPRPKAGLKEKK